jgi:hypothetical protein
MSATATSPVREKRPSLEASTGQKHNLNWLGFALFLALMAYPFVAHYLPLGIREYLSATFK